MRTDQNEEKEKQANKKNVQKLETWQKTQISIEYNKEHIWHCKTI